MLATDPYLVMSTTTQRQTEGHEHPDRGSFSLYHDGIPLVLDPGVGWCGYQWFNYPLVQASAAARGANGTSFDRNLQQYDFICVLQTLSFRIFSHLPGVKPRAFDMQGCVVPRQSIAFNGQLCRRRT